MFPLFTLYRLSKQKTSSSSFGDVMCYKKLESSKVKTFITSSSPMDNIIRNLHLEQKSFFLLYLDYKSGRKKISFL